jgi:hypothetical protein
MSTSYESDSESSESDSEEEEGVSEDFLQALLAKAHQSYAAEAEAKRLAEKSSDIIALSVEDTNKWSNIFIYLDYSITEDAWRPLPRLKVTKQPSTYFPVDTAASGSYLSIKNPDVESMEKLVASLPAPTPPVPPPELSKSGKPLTKREKREVGVSCW